MSVSASLRAWARRIKRDGVTLWFASRNPRMPLLPKIICIVAVAYALSPIDLIPDFIPVLGYLDDVILLPALIWLAVRLAPTEVIAAGRVEADRWMAEQGAKPRSRAGAVAIVALWCAAAGLAWQWWA
jgi:uncharacterized membrane protein YkvA (DUF1232 family)